jgi:hypothetical protein
MALLQTATNHEASPLAHYFLSEKPTASFLGVSFETLRTWRKQGRGPRYRRFGRCIRYSFSDLKAFIEASPAGGGRLDVPSPNYLRAISNIARYGAGTRDAAETHVAGSVLANDAPRGLKAGGRPSHGSVEVAR